MKEDFLRKLGLSSYEIGVFLALTQTGQLKAKDISKISGIPHGRIYDVLYSLEKRGLVSVIPSEPRIFEAVESGIAIDSLIEQERMKLGGIEKEKKAVLKEFNSSRTLIPPSKEKERISVYYGSDAAINIGRVGIERARKEVLINTTRLEDTLAQEIMARKMLEGVSLKVMVPYVTKKNARNIKRIKDMGGEVRLGGIEGMKIGIVDTEGTSITVTNPKNLKGSITIVVEGKNFAKSMKNFFMVYWNAARHTKS
jgi:sugar-specific transcriptional regulator TrmB